MFYRLPEEVLSIILLNLPLFEQVKLACCSKHLLPRGPVGCMKLSRPTKTMFRGAKPPAQLRFLTFQNAVILSRAWGELKIDLSESCISVRNMLKMYDQYWKQQMPRWLTYHPLFAHEQYLTVSWKQSLSVQSAALQRRSTVKLSFLRRVKNNKNFHHEIRLISISPSTPSIK